MLLYSWEGLGGILGERENEAGELLGFALYTVVGACLA